MRRLWQVCIYDAKSLKSYDPLIREAVDGRDATDFWQFRQLIPRRIHFSCTHSHARLCRCGVNGCMVTARSCVGVRCRHTNRSTHNNLSYWVPAWYRKNVVVNVRFSCFLKIYTQKTCANTHTHTGPYTNATCTRKNTHFRSAH